MAISEIKLPDGSVHDIKDKTAAGHIADGDIHVTAAEKIKWDGKAEKSDIPTELPANGGNADTVSGKSPNLFVENMLNQNFHFSMVFGDHAYITNTIDSKIPNLPVASNYMHIISRDESGNVNAVISLGTDYTLDTYTYSSGSWRKINDGGNANALDGYDSTKFVRNENPPLITTSINECYTSGSYTANFSQTPDYPSDIAGNWGLLNVFTNGSVRYQLMMTEGGMILFRSAIIGQTSWSEWKRLDECSGGNAASVGSYTEAKIAALEARIAALEGSK